MMIDVDDRECLIITQKLQSSYVLGAWVRLFVLYSVRRAGKSEGGGKGTTEPTAFVMALGGATNERTKDCRST